MTKNIKTHTLSVMTITGDLLRMSGKDFQIHQDILLLSFPTREEFINHLEQEKEHKFCKVAILGLHDTKEQL